MIPILVMNGPSWHATPAHLNAATAGLGAGMQWDEGSNSLSVAIGGYKNSDYQHTNYLMAMASHRLSTHWSIALTGGIVTGYPLAQNAPMDMADAIYTRGSISWIMGVIPKTRYNPVVVNLAVEVRL